MTGQRPCEDWPALPETHQGRSDQEDPALWVVVYWMLAAEQPFSDFQRTFTVPQTIQADAIHAETAHGVLKIHLPKVSAQKPRQINVKAS